MGFTSQLTCLLVLACLLIPCHFAPPPRCVCYQTVSFIPERMIQDFKIFEKGTYCTKNEIIVKLRRNNKEVCLSPVDKQGQDLLSCWLSINKDERLTKTCIRRKQK